MYIDAKEQKPDDKARLISPVQLQTAGACVHFYMHSLGAVSGKLNLYVKTEDQLGVPVWSKPSGNFGRDWLLGKIGVTSISSSWQAVFEAVRGSGDNGNMGKGSFVNRGAVLDWF